MLTVSYLYAVGAFDTFWFWTVEYASAYGAQIPLSGAFEAFKSGVSDVTEGFLFFWIMAISGFMVMFFYEGLKGRRVFIALFSFFSFLTICPGFYFRPHYFITLLPAVSILIGIITDWLSFRSAAFFKTEYARFIGVAVFIAATGAAIASERTYLFEESPVKLSRTVYGANPFPESLEIARFIESRSARTDRVAVFGSEPQIFFYAKRHSATGYIYTYTLMESHSYALRMQQEMIREVESAEPKFIVVVKIATSWLMRSESEKYILLWLNGYIRDKYRLVGAVDIISSDMTIYKWDRDAQEYAIRSPYHVLITKRAATDYTI